MAKWPIALALLVAAVGLHVFGLVRQIRHYREMFGELSTRWPGARIGTGAAGGSLAPSVMAILVADPQGRVLAARLRLGRGSFAKFLPREDLVGLSLAEVRARAADFGPDIAGAWGQALDAIEATDTNVTPA